MAKKRLVQGVGVNDVDAKTIDKNGNRCIAYMKWKTMINRVYGKKLAEKWKGLVDDKVYQALFNYDVYCGEKIND